MDGKVRRIRWTTIVAAVVMLALTLIVLCVSFQPESAKIAKESNVQIEQLSSVQIRNMQKVCKVWGFVKYYHPEVAAGKVDWDRELFKMIRIGLQMKTDKQMDEILYELITALGEPIMGTSKKAAEVRLAPTTGWIADEQYVTLVRMEM